MVAIRNDIKFTDHLIVPDLSTLLHKLLLLQTIIIEVSLHCFDK